MKRLLRKLLSLFRSKSTDEEEKHARMFVNDEAFVVVKTPQVGFSTAPLIKQMGGFIDTEYELRKEAMRSDSISIGDVINDD